MNKLMFRVGGTLAVGALLASSVAGAAFADNTITGNGAGSSNTISVVNTCTVSVGQSNVSDISVKVNQSANTGGNEANNNTGGNVSISTGNVDQTANVTVNGSSNTVGTLPSCCGCQETTPGNTISGNGEGTTNVVADVTTKTTAANQSNTSRIRVKVKQKAKTGKNKANSNTNGTTDVTTGGITAGATVGVTGSTNNLP